MEVSKLGSSICFCWLLGWQIILSGVKFHLEQNKSLTLSAKNNQFDKTLHKQIGSVLFLAVCTMKER